MSAHVEAARSRVEARMDARGTITRAVDGEVTIDPVTLAATGPEPDTLHDDVPCSVGDATEGRMTDRAGQQIMARSVPVAVPVAITGVETGDTFTLTSVGPDGDPDLIGIPLTVAEVDHRTTVVLRRLRCIDTRGTNGRLP